MALVEKQEEGAGLEEVLWIEWREKLWLALIVVVCVISRLFLKLSM